MWATSVALVLSALTLNLFYSAAMVACIAHIAGQFAAAWPLAIASVRRVLARVIVFDLLSSIATLLGIMLCVIPSLVVGALWTLALPLIVLERQSVVSAVREGYRRGTGFPKAALDRRSSSVALR